MLKINCTMRQCKKTYIVGVDGSQVSSTKACSPLGNAIDVCTRVCSQLSMRAVMHACYLVDQYADNLLLVSLGRSEKDEQDMTSRFLPKAKDIAQRSGLDYNRLYTEHVSLPSGMGIDEALIYLTDHTTPGGAVLVIGCAGKGDESKKGARKNAQPPIGSIAQACLDTCRQPVVLVKSGEAPAEGSERIKRIGNDGTPGINIMVSLDESVVSRKAFDIALSLGTRGMTRRKDTLFLYHVQQPGDQDVYQEYTPMCAPPPAGAVGAVRGRALTP